MVVKTPVPIPNTVVKSLTADDSESTRESRYRHFYDPTWEQFQVGFFVLLCGLSAGNKKERAANGILKYYYATQRQGMFSFFLMGYCFGPLRQMITVHQLTHHYGLRPVLTDVSCDIDKGDLVVLLGPNGSGKR